MDSLLTVSFEAHNADRNHHRRYEIRLGRDLFGEWTVSLLYGRTGRGGQEVRHSGFDAERLRRVIRESLKDNILYLSRTIPQKEHGRNRLCVTGRRLAKMQPGS